MTNAPDDCRREAELFEQSAKCVSLQSDKEELLATAQSLRRSAAMMEAHLPDSEQTASPQATAARLARRQLSRRAR